jgi:hypothetical protein
MKIPPAATAGAPAVRVREVVFMVLLPVVRDLGDVHDGRKQGGEHTSPCDVTRLVIRQRRCRRPR